MTKRINRQELYNMNTEELDAALHDVLECIKNKEFFEGLDLGSSLKVDLEEKSDEVSVQQAPTREEIIQRAKIDVDELVHQAYQGDVERIDLPLILRAGNLSTKFNIDKDKRVVAAILDYKFIGGFRSRGISRCDPKDCFNSHIGKAIALRRALGLDVPEEYLNAPQPTKPQVGDVVDAYLSGGEHLSTFTVTGFFLGAPNKLMDEEGYGYIPFQPHCGDRIIDDSRE